MTPLTLLTLVIGWMLALLLGALGVIVLWRIVDGTIDLKLLLSEKDGSASLSRFQFFIFTFVIGMSFFLIVVGGERPLFPEIPTGVFSLLGISAGTYAVSKGMQLSHDANPDVMALKRNVALAQVKEAEARVAEAQATARADLSAAPRPLVAADGQPA